MGCPRYSRHGSLLMQYVGEGHQLQGGFALLRKKQHKEL